MPYRLAPLVIVLAALGPARADAETRRSGALRAMLAELPVVFVLPGTFDFGQVLFGDVAAAARIERPALPGLETQDLGPVLPALRALPYERWGAHLGGLGEGWAALIGFAAQDMAQTLAVVAPPVQVTLARLSPDAAAALPAALVARGYAPLTSDGVSALAVGEDFAIDPAAGDAEDIFRGALGMAARVQTEGGLIRHANAWPLLAALSDPQWPPSTTHPPLAALMDALDALDPRTGVLVQARLYPDPRRAGLDLDGMLLFADLDAGDTMTAVIALFTGEDAASAGARARAIAGAYGERSSRLAPGQSFAALTGAPADVVLHETAAGPVIVLSATAPATIRFGMAENGAHAILLQAFLRRDLVFLQD